MFDPRSSADRVNYGDALLPPSGFTLERAVGTTYSLELEALVAVSIALGLIEEVDSELTQNPISMLNALQKVSDKITVFCEAGQIKLPAKNNPLYLMLERMVVPVKLVRDNSIGRYAAFHPKTWILEYKDLEGNTKYRFVVLSRNLTFDHSWDVAFSVDGELREDKTGNNTALISYLKFLEKQLDKDLQNYERQNRDIKHFIGVIPNLVFVLDDNRFSSFDFMPLGIGANSYEMNSDDLFTDSFDDLIVMSPFLSGSIIATFNEEWKSSNKRTLFTRKTEIAKLNQDKASNFDIYVMKDCVIDGESAISECSDNDGDSDVSDYRDDQKSTAFQQDIHAKLFLLRRGRNVDLYLGSMNATYAAVNANVEMMIRLRTRKKHLDAQSFLRDIMGEDPTDKKNPFELVNLTSCSDESIENTVQDSIEQIIKTICRLNMRAYAVLNEEGKYDVTLVIETSRSFDGKVMISPIRSSNRIEIADKMVFSALDSLELSEFYILSVTINDCTLERVLMIPTEGIPEKRDSEIIKHVIRNKKTFLEYVAFVLGEEYLLSFLENKKHHGKKDEWNSTELMPAIYEKMLRTSVNNPERIKDIQLITRVIDDETIIPKEFSDMYQTFCSTLGLE